MVLEYGVIGISAIFMLYGNFLVND